MTDISHTIVARSSQQNADDYLSGPRTITVTRVELTESADQPVAVFFNGDEGKPYLPCKTCRRIMVRVWGPHAEHYTGRSMTIYRDDTVRFGGLSVGGIRISHMSHIDKEVTMVLQETKGKKKPFIVKPLKLDTAPVKAQASAPATTIPAAQSAPPDAPPSLDDDIPEIDGAVLDYADEIEHAVDQHAGGPSIVTWFNADVSKTEAWAKLKAADPARAAAIKGKVIDKK